MCGRVDSSWGHWELKWLFFRDLASLCFPGNAPQPPCTSLLAACYLAGGFSVAEAGSVSHVGIGGSWWVLRAYARQLVDSVGARVGTILGGAWWILLASARMAFATSQDLALSISGGLA